MNTCLGRSCSFGLMQVPSVNCCQFMHLLISLLVLRAANISRIKLRHCMYVCMYVCMLVFSGVSNIPYPQNI